MEELIIRTHFPIFYLHTKFIFESLSTTPFFILIAHRLKLNTFSKELEKVTKTQPLVDENSPPENIDVLSKLIEGVVNNFESLDCTAEEIIMFEPYYVGKNDKRRYCRISWDSGESDVQIASEHAVAI